jgi:hypothetical protein
MGLTGKAMVKREKGERDREKQNAIQRLAE